MNLLSLDFIANCQGPITLRQFTLVDDGTGTANDFSAIYASIGHSVKTHPAGIDAKNRTVTLRFLSPLVVPECKRVQVDILVDVASSIPQGSTHSLAIELPSDIISNVDGVYGNFPIRSQVFTVRENRADKVRCYRKAGSAESGSERREARALCRRTKIDLP